VTLWARRPATLEPFADTSAKTAGSPAEAERETSEPGDGVHRDADHGDGERGATLLAAADAALTLMNVARMNVARVTVASMNAAGRMAGR